MLKLYLLVLTLLTTASLALGQTGMVVVDLEWDAAPDHTANTRYDIHACNAPIPDTLTCASGLQTFDMGVGNLSGQISYATPDTTGTLYMRATAQEGTATSLPSNEVSQAYDFNDLFVQIVGPVDGLEVHGNVTFTIWATDSDGIASATLHLASDPLVEIAGVFPGLTGQLDFWSWVLDTSRVPDSITPVALIARATDNLGNTLDSDPITVTFVNSIMNPTAIQGMIDAAIAAHEVGHP